MIESLHPSLSVLVDIDRVRLSSVGCHIDKSGTIALCRSDGNSNKSTWYVGRQVVKWIGVGYTESHDCGWVSINSKQYIIIIDVVNILR